MARSVVTGECPREPAWAVSDVIYYGIGQCERRHAKGAKEPESSRDTVSDTVTVAQNRRLSKKKP